MLIDTPLGAPATQACIAPKPTDAELITPAVIQAPLGFGSEACFNRSTVTPNPPAAKVPPHPRPSRIQQAPTPARRVSTLFRFPCAAPRGRINNMRAEYFTPRDYR